MEATICHTSQAQRSAFTLACRYPYSVITKTANGFLLSTWLSVSPSQSSLLMGMISAFFVPKLLMGVPRRGFDLYSWRSAFYSCELIAERKSGIDKDIELEEIVEQA